MSLLTFNSKRKRIALFLLSVFILECSWPVASLALTSGPSQPEFSSFEPVATTGMVNEFSGSFTYNLPVLAVPGAQGGGYAMSLSYHNNVTSEQDASWVGLGWTLNPGSISRNSNGIPDDFKGQDVEYYYKSRDNDTWTVLLNAATEFASGDIGVGVETGIRWNTFRGFSTVQGFNASAFGAVSLQLGVDDGVARFDAKLTPGALVGKFLRDETQDELEEYFDLCMDDPQEETAEFAEDFAKELKKVSRKNNATSRLSNSMGAAISTYVSRSLTSARYPNFGPETVGKNYSIRFGLMGDVLSGIPIGTGFRIGASGNWSNQTGRELVQRQVYGNLYTGHVVESSDVMDYYVDKGAAFEERDKYLGVPHINYDNFNLMGEGLGGVIRPFSQSVGVLRPQKQESTTDMYDLGVDLTVGAKWAVGGQVSSGYSLATLSGVWGGAGGFQKDIIEDGFVRDHRGTFLGFDGDRGMNMVFSETAEAIRASAKLGPMSVPQSAYYSRANDGSRPGASSNVRYVTNAEMMDTIPNKSFRYNCYTQEDEYLHQFIDRNDPALADQIGELSVVNAAGNRYVYGLPVYSRRENTLSFEPTKSDVENNTSYNGKFTQNKELAKHMPNAYYAGQYQETPYASQFLLTTITNAEYIDLTGDGPSSDDFGGYTSFGYRRTAGTQNKSTGNPLDWYKWRLPYVGFNVSNGKLLDGYDDRLSVSYGEREQYYLSEVRTKTHVAYFITNKRNETVASSDGTIELKGSGQERFDGYEAYRFNDADTTNERESAMGKARYFPTGEWDPNLAGKQLQTHSKEPNYLFTDSTDVEPIENKQEYLERIVLYALDADGKPHQLVKTVHFEYDYSLMAFNPESPSYTMVEYGNGEEMPPTYTGPTYHYPTHLNSATYFNFEGVLPEHNGTHAVARKMGKLTLKRVWSEYNGVVNAEIAPYDFDYRYPVEEDYAKPVSNIYEDILIQTSSNGINLQEDWNNPQNPHYSSNSSDRWGHYRPKGSDFYKKHFPYTTQNDTSQLAAAPWTLKRITLPSGGEIQVHYEDHDYSFVQDQRAMAMVGISDVTESQDDIILTVEEDLKIESIEEKMWLVDEMKRKFIDEKEKLYFRFLYNFACEYSEEEISTMKSPPTTGVDFVKGYVDVSDVLLDENNNIHIRVAGDITFEDLAKDYELTTVLGLDCEDHYSGTGGATGSGQDFAQALLGAIPGVGTGMALARQWGEGPEILELFSHVRIPVTKSKRGGGVRVKRILMYDEGLETGDAVLYGTEYTYETKRSIGGKTYTVSSGVATNEPASGRDENALVQFMERRSDRNFFEVVSAGRDLEQHEGPMHEGQLPGPSIGYSRIVVQNIHQGKTGTGFNIVEYNTAKDFPMIAQWTTMDKKESNSNPVFGFLMNFSRSDHAAAQGYTFVNSNLHGTEKRISSYGGQYSDPSSHYLVSSKETNYFDPMTETIPLYNGPGESISQGWPGMTTEIAMENRVQKDLFKNHIVLWDVGLIIPSAVLFPLPFGHVAYRQVHQESTLRTHVTVKNTSYPPVVKSTTVYSEGIWHISKNLAFDPVTGMAAITQTHDGYDDLSLAGSSTNHVGTYTSYTIPGHTQYTALGQQVNNEDLEYLSGNITTSSGAFYYEHSSQDMAFAEGDFVKLTYSNGDVELAHVGEIISSQKVKLLPSYNSVSPTTLSVQSDVQAHILQSGRTNQLAINVGSITTYGETADLALSGNILTSTRLDTSVLSASALTLSDNWNYSSSQYQGVDPNANAYESGQRGKWRANASYVYMAPRRSAQGTSQDRTYARAGVYSTFDVFNWHGSSSSRWLQSVDITSYSPHGEVLEEENALEIPSSASFAHQQLVPAIVAANAHQQDVVFESYEDKVVGGSLPAPENCHTGKNSENLLSTSSVQPKSIVSVDVSSRMNSSGMLVRFWCKSSTENKYPFVKIGSGSFVQADSIAHNGEWKLYEVVELSPTQGTNAIQMYMEDGVHSWVDDIRVQPLDASATCYVYDSETLRLVAQFDDQHFASLYQYNGEGQLVRQMKETVRGTKTLAETQYNTPLRSRTLRETPPLSQLQQAPSNHQGVETGIQRLAKPVQSPFIESLERASDPSSQGTSILDIRMSPTTQEIEVFGNPTQDSSKNDNK